jgi:ribonucleoside-diphosphate reductase beta chain
MSIFEKRVSFKPFEYPDMLRFKDAIRHSYWLHTEYNVSSDVQDFKANITDSEREVIKKTMLAISQIEISVKTFWAKIYDRMPKPEVGAVGMTFADSEVRHADAYAFLLEQLGLNEEFSKIHEIPAIIDRVDYLSKHLSGTKSNDNKEYTLSVLLFSVFVEHVSLFSQFLIMMSFNKHKNMFKGISNIVEATSKEEEIHGLFGIHIVDILKKEHPEWFDQDFEDKIVNACRKAYKAELKMIDWIFETGELEFLSKKTVDNFIKNRFNGSLINLEIEPIFEVDEEEITKTLWFDEEIKVTKDNDFFNKRSTTYTKKTKSIGPKDLFDNE